MILIRDVCVGLASRSCERAYPFHARSRKGEAGHHSPFRLPVSRARVHHDSCHGDALARQDGGCRETSNRRQPGPRSKCLDAPAPLALSRHGRDQCHPSHCTFFGKECGTAMTPTRTKPTGCGPSSSGAGRDIPLPGIISGAFIWPIERSAAHSLTNQYGGFRVRQHLVCHTAD